MRKKSNYTANWKFSTAALWNHDLTGFLIFEMSERISQFFSANAVSRSLFQCIASPSEWLIDNILCSTTERVPFEFDERRHGAYQANTCDSRSIYAPVSKSSANKSNPNLQIRYFSYIRPMFSFQSFRIRVTMERERFNCSHIECVPMQRFQNLPLTKYGQVWLY